MEDVCNPTPVPVISPPLAVVSHHQRKDATAKPKTDLCFVGNILSYACSFLARPRSLLQILARFSGCCGEESGHWRKKICNNFKVVKI
jgi:hypothetical protein